jgi:dihydrodipicolinate synthase/N-acetylneuraminate lyase
VRGVIAALITPYNGYGGIDTDGVGQLAERAIAGGVDALLVNAPIGEAPHLSRGERLFVIEAAREAAAGRVPLTREALIAHYHAIVRRGRLPIVPHNAPTRLGNALSPATLATLATATAIAAIVQDGRDPVAFAEASDLIAGDVTVLAGDANAIDLAGVAGLVSALAGILPGATVAAYRPADAAQWALLGPLRALLADEGRAVATAKAALTILGLPGGLPRAPMPGLTAAEHAALVALLDTLAGADVAPTAAPPTILPPR